MPRKRTTITRTRKRSAGKRDTVTAKNATFYAKHTARGRFKEMDEKSGSLEGRPPHEGEDQDPVRVRGPRRPRRVAAGNLHRASPPARHARGSGLTRRSTSSAAAI